MTELLSREQEFIQINEQLNRIVNEPNPKLNTGNLKMVAPDGSRKQYGYGRDGRGGKNYNNGGGVGGNGNAGAGGYFAPVAASPDGSIKPDQTRFRTYTRNRGPSTMMRKRVGGGGGDSYPEPTYVPRMLPGDYQRSPRHYKNGPAMIDGTYVRIDDDTTRSPMPPGVNNANGCYVSQDNNAYNMRTYTRHQTSRNNHNHPGHNNNHYNNSHESQPFHICYQNSKFTESPSLESFVKGQCATIQQSESSITVNESTASGSTPLSPETKNQHGNGTGNMKKPVSQDGLIKFFKSKISILEQNHSRLTREMRDQKDLLDQAVERQKKAEQQRDQALAKNTTLTEQVTRLETQCEELNRRNKEHVAESLATNKELESLRREIKVLQQTNSNLEKRLSRASEEIESSKNELNELKNLERELKENTRIMKENKEKQLKYLKKQRADLLTAYKKQIFLIDNLKRQNTCMEQSQMIAFCDKEFARVLDWHAAS